MRGKDDFGTYLTNQHREIAKSNKISLNTVNSRINRGWTVEKAISLKPIRKDTDYHEARKKANEIGVSNDTFKRRIQRGMTLERASTTPLIPPTESQKSSVAVRKRVVKKELVELAKKNGIPYNTLYSRLCRWQCEYTCATLPQIKTYNWRIADKGFLQRYGYVK